MAGSLHGRDCQQVISGWIIAWPRLPRGHQWLDHCMAATAKRPSVAGSLHGRDCQEAVAATDDPATDDQWLDRHQPEALVWNWTPPHGRLNSQMCVVINHNIK